MLTEKMVDRVLDKVVQRAGEGRGKPMDASNTVPAVVENCGGGLSPTVDGSYGREDVCLKKI